VAVAIKQIRFKAKPEELEAMKREASLGHSLKNDNVVRLFGLTTYRSRMALVMEWADQGSIL
jgi:hypothetical protein